MIHALLMKYKSSPNFSTFRASKYSGLSVISTVGFARRSILIVPRTLVNVPRPVLTL